MSTEWSVETGARVIADHAGGRGALLPVLHALQDEFGYVDAARDRRSWPTSLNLSRAEVHGVVTFYRDFRTEPPGRHRRDLPRRGVPGGRRPTRSRTARRRGSGSASARRPPTARSRSTQVFCLGNCALWPAVMVDGRAACGRVDACRAVDALLADGRGRSAR